MANQGAKTSSLNCGGSYTIPAGYHNGSGKVTANSLASQTSATATAGNIQSGYTAWVNGNLITGTLIEKLSGATYIGNIKMNYSIGAVYDNVTMVYTSNFSNDVNLMSGDLLICVNTSPMVVGCVYGSAVYFITGSSYTDANLETYQVYRKV